MKNRKRDVAKIRAELDAVQDAHDGLLRMEDVVAYAKDKATELHHQFDWDDRSAGHQYRLWQARKLVAIYVETLVEDTDPVRTYVSLSTDRGEGGYRRTREVLSDAGWREQLLEDAIRDLERIRSRYSSLTTLAKVFEALDVVADKARRRRRRKPGKK